ncbi:1-deoxy-D-xylulose-5-phosphate synthase N-terminal domain-containing protein [soil metagenome]
MNDDLRTLESIQRRVLWLAVRMVDHANRERPPGEIKVGGHQTSSASMVGIMTALWFDHLSGADKVAVKPHASPVYHAIKYLTGELDRTYLTRLRALGGLQSYPSRIKDPDVFDFSTGSVGLGVVAPLFAAAARRYVEAQDVDRPAARFIALAGDAELDEGNVWEAITEPALQGLGNVMLVVDANRQSLDRVVPDQKIKKLMEFFDGAGWHVVEAKYGRRLQDAFTRPGGEALRAHIDAMSNEEYQSLFAHRGDELRKRFVHDADNAVRRLLQELPEDEVAPLVLDLGGHDLGLLGDAYRACDAVADRPSVVFAYTIKGWGLPMAGDPLNHSMLLSGEQIDELRRSLGLTTDDEWDRFDPSTPEGRRCASVGGELNNVAVPSRPQLPVPAATGIPASGRMATQEAFGRILTRLADVEGVGGRIVTVSPDVSVSTNLGGWINKVGVFTPDERTDFGFGDGSEQRLLRWHQSPSGRHVELGISEMNLFLMLHALGLGHELHGHHLLPIGTVYDPFVCRGLDALIFGLYSGARFVVVGTPAGITLAPEGGAHQSTITPSIGAELPALTYHEPAYARALDWLLCDALVALGDPSGGSTYLRLSTRPIDQAPFAVAAERRGVDALRADVLAGAYRLLEPDGPAEVVLAGCGPVVPEMLAAAGLLADEDVPTLVVDITSPDRVYRGWRESRRAASRDASVALPTHHLATLLAPSERRLPLVTVHDAASHHLAWLGSVFGAPVVPVGVDEFGQSGSIPELYETFDLLPDQLVNAALVALSLRS